MNMNEWLIKYFFPARLKALREAKGRNQESLAKLLKVNQRTISNWEKGKVQPSLNMLLDLSFELNINVAYLLCHDKVTFNYLVCNIAENGDLLHDNMFDINFLRQQILKIPFNESALSVSKEESPEYHSAFYKYSFKGVTFEEFMKS